jgi:hypothetical protein
MLGSNPKSEVCTLWQNVRQQSLSWHFGSVFRVFLVTDRVLAKHLWVSPMFFLIQVGHDKLGTLQTAETLQ